MKKKKKITIKHKIKIIFEAIIILNTNVTVIKIEYYWLKNILIKLDHI